MLKSPSIFIKIFLGFWLVTLLSSSCVYVLSLIDKSLRSSQHSEQTAEERRNLMGQSLTVYGQTAKDLLQHENAEAVSRYSLIISHSAGIRPHFFFESDAPLSAEPPPSEVRSLAQKALASRQREYMQHRDIFVLAQPVEDSPGRFFVVVGETRLDESGLAAPSIRKPGPGQPPQAPPPAQDSLMRLAAGYLGQKGGDTLTFFLALLVVGGLVCYWLTRHLTAPLLKLRQAARQMTGGDLSVRVGDEFGRRGDEIAGLGRDFDLMAENLEKLIALHHRLLRDVAHELRSPLARLNVALELAGQCAAADLPSALDRIRRESERLNTLINQLLLLARLDHSPELSRPEKIHLTPLLREVVQDVNYEIQGSDRRVEAHIQGDAVVSGNPELLRQAVENVVRNAARYTAEGTAVEVSLVIEGEREAHIQVRDHGPGVPEESLQQIFRAFYRVGESREQRAGGVGIGLAIAEGAIRAHKGSIRAANAPGGGLLLEMRLPCAPA